MGLRSITMDGDQSMAENEKTSAEIARIAAKGLKIGKLTPVEIKKISGSVLTQVQDSQKPKTKPKPPPKTKPKPPPKTKPKK